MRFIILVKASADSEAGVMPSEQKMLEYPIVREPVHKTEELIHSAG